MSVSANTSAATKHLGSRFSVTSAHRVEEMGLVSLSGATSLSKTILQGTSEGGRQRKCWMDNIKELTSLYMPELLTRASCGTDWKRIFAESSLVSLTTQLVKGLN